MSLFHKGRRTDRPTVRQLDFCSCTGQLKKIATITITTVAITTITITAIAITTIKLTTVAFTTITITTITFTTVAVTTVTTVTCISFEIRMSRSQKYFILKIIGIKTEETFRI